LIILVELVLRHFHRYYYKSSPLWFIVDEDLRLLSSNYKESIMDTVVYVVLTARV
jgi:hypothetical protein